MDSVTLLPPGGMGRGFIPGDEYRHRDAQAPWPTERWRRLDAGEIDRLKQNGNDSDAWEELLVTDVFDAGQIRNTRFYGRVRIGALRNVVLEHHGLRVPAGITNSVIASCDIGDDAAVHNVAYMARVIVGDRSILLTIDEIYATSHARFGNGIVKEGEPENGRLRLDLINETGCRSVPPFDGIIPADAYLWARYRDDAALQERLKTITQNGHDASPGYYATVGSQCVIRSCRIIEDVKIGPHCRITGADMLKNLTINSSEEEQTHIGQGVELVDGIIGRGCRVSNGCKAVGIVLGDNANLKYGARIINSLVGDNSTISCCEVQNALIFPAHEQHHNNSFLIASLIMGQSNLAAGATIGSNHNSRANDNELQAGRGFWPGLCASLKHPCRFASFVLLSKADYPAELDIPLPFSLLDNDAEGDRLMVMPAFWWLYNMYALARNTWKFQDRDKRKNKVQHIEFDFLAPDTVEEIIAARRLLEIWTAKAYSRSRAERAAEDENELAAVGADLLFGPAEVSERIEILGENMEKSDRKVVILKTRRAYDAYTDMLHYYAVKNLVLYLKADPSRSFAGMCEELSGARKREWINLGGQLVPREDVDRLRSDIGDGTLGSWDDVHRRYDALWERYPREKQGHAFSVLCMLLDMERPSEAQWRSELNRGMKIQELIRDQVYLSRKKDFENPFRRAMYRREEEMTACLGTIEDNGFIKLVRAETETFRGLVEEIGKRG